LHDPEKLTYKYITAWMNFGISVSSIGTTWHIFVDVHQCSDKQIIRIEKGAT
jgi:hypothetical protein